MHSWHIFFTGSRQTIFLHCPTPQTEANHPYFKWSNGRRFSFQKWKKHTGGQTFLFLICRSSCLLCFCTAKTILEQVDLNLFKLFLCHFCSRHANRKNCLLSGGQFRVKIICTILVQGVMKSEDLKGKRNTDNTWKSISFSENLKYLYATVCS